MIYLPFSNFGCFVSLSNDRKTIFTLPMDTDGEMDDSCEATIVSEPEESFLNEVNRVFKTDFQPKDFSGRS